MFIFQDTIWLGGEHDGYDLLPFIDYSKKRTKASSIRESAAALQSLLTFGLMEAVMEEKIAEKELLQLDSSGRQRVMTDTNLPQLLQRWRQRIRYLQLLPGHNGAELSMAWARRVQVAFSQARSLLMVETLQPEHSIFIQAGLRPRQRAHIVLLIGSIAEALMVSSRVFPFNATPRRFSTAFMLAQARQQKADMITVGWCPFMVEILAENVCVAGYASTHRPYERESGNGHRNCSVRACVMNTLDVDTYKSQHIMKACSCETYRPVLGDIVGTLEAGKVPVLVHPPRGTCGELKSSDSSSTPYVAISHVWADGLGSTTEDGLPLCQIKRLAAAAETLIPGGGFWIDALCIPRIRDMRKRAIGLMAKTYAEATVVLVLDSGIRSISSSAPREERLLRMMSSGWMQRLWTLQEGVLARKLVFEFSDGPLALEELLPVGEELFDTALLSLAAEIFRLKKHHIQLQGQQKSDLRISDVAQALRWRSTSRSSDETLAISGLLKVDAFELASLPSEERMQRLLLGVRSLPSDVVFIHGARMSQPGFRWAPKTLMRASVTSLAFGIDDASCTPSGLIAKYTVVHFPTITIDSEDEWCIRDSSNHRMYRITDVWLGKYAAEIECATIYRCNAVLLMRPPTPSETMACAVVLFPEGEDGGGENVRVCEFKKRLLLKDISELEAGQVRTIASTEFEETLGVKIT